MKMQSTVTLWYTHPSNKQSHADVIKHKKTEMEKISKEGI